jgi:hypothetical protein
LQQQEEQLAAQIARPQSATAAQQGSRADIQRFEDEARHETLDQPLPPWNLEGKAYQYAERQRQYEGAKIAAARRGLNSNMVVPPRYDDVYYDPLIRFKEAMSQSGLEAPASNPQELRLRLDNVRKEKEQVRQQMERAKHQP